MSLLEDVFLQDEAGEAQQLERIIDGDDYDERPRDRSDSDENSEKEDEAEEDKRRVDPASTKTKRVIKNPRFILNPARLTGPRGIQVIPEHFKDFKFKGKGHEKEDLDLVLKKLEHWAYRLYPKFEFEDCLKKIETLGKKRPVMVHLTKIRSDQLVSEETVVQQDSSDEEPAPAEEDEFDKLLAQQIQLARNTPAPGSGKKPGFGTPVGDKISPITMPKATSSPSISDEQRERMIRNRKLAEERRLARLKAQTQNETNTIDLTNIVQNGDKNYNSKSSNKNDYVEIINEDRNEEVNNKKARTNRSNIIESSDSENDMVIDEIIDVNDKNDYENRVAGKNNTSPIELPNSINDINVTKRYQSKQLNEENTIFDQLLNVDSETIDITNDTAKSKKVVAADSDIIDMTRTENTRFDQLLNDDSETIDITNDTAKSKGSVTVDSDIIDMTRTENTRYDQVLDGESETIEITNDTTKSKESVAADSDIIDMTGTENTRFNKLTVDKVAEKVNEFSNVNSEIVDITEGDTIKKSVATDEIINENEQQNEKIQKKKSRLSNMIDSSDSDEDFAVAAVNECITVDVHKNASQIDPNHLTESSEILNNDIDKNGKEKPHYETENLTTVTRDNDFEVERNKDSKNGNKKSTYGLTKDLATYLESPNEKVDSQTEISHNSDLEIGCENQEKVNENFKADQSNVNKELLDEKETQLEDLMDVDFSDDF